ncbi:Pv-fam-d protein [Plasmodium cynomolgi strain B]|uniref:Pv-fam-d protein n=1 Tax=Plasmodium cynomolgi (strain B) TaxID=1120755 RepID=K6UF22_PLACD|nr:Pv-fam-d protein [Plasmodium cynomolgi strain B]GAB69346.1 Pv-fam-d protein [Plasmodium cynomolgi strain B]
MDHNFQTAAHDNVWDKNIHLKGRFGARTSRLFKGKTEHKSPKRYAYSKEKIIDILEENIIHFYDGKYQISPKHFTFVDNIDRQFSALNKSDDLNSLFNPSESVNDDKKKKGYLNILQEATNIEITDDSIILIFLKKIDSKFESEIFRLLKKDNKYYLSKHKPGILWSFLERNKIFMPFVVNVFIIIICALHVSDLCVCTYQILGFFMAIYFKYKKHKCQKVLKRS